MIVADALSRASLDGTPEINSDEMLHHVHSIINQIPASPSFTALKAIHNQWLAIQREH